MNAEGKQITIVNLNLEQRGGGGVCPEHGPLEVNNVLKLIMSVFYTCLKMKTGEGLGEECAKWKNTRMKNV